MGRKTINPITLIAIVILFFSVVTLSYADSVEWTIMKTLQLKESAIDVVLSPDGKRIFVLSDQGKIIIYSSISKVEAEIDVGKDVNQIELGPKGDILILNNRKNKTVQFVTIDFIQNINVSGSPFKGSEDAPVVVAVFSDFE